MPVNEATLQPGYILIDKPPGITSHDVIDHVRRLFNIKKVGHAGTLDPMATGLLIVLLGRNATKKSNLLIGLDKTYHIGMNLGYSTDSLDSDGVITNKIDTNSSILLALNQDTIIAAIKNFEGQYDQTVPLFSAIKVDGEKMYKLGYAQRKGAGGKDIKLPSRQVVIHKISDIRLSQDNNTNYPLVTFKAHVGSGTYTRSLVRDIGIKLKIPTVQVYLRRLSVGNYHVDQAVPMADLTKDDIIPIEQLTVG